jgi:hypothetical protein
VKRAEAVLKSVPPNGRKCVVAVVVMVVVVVVFSCQPAASPCPLSCWSKIPFGHDCRSCE